MIVTWERTWPRWLGVACAVFGLANVVGTFVQALTSGSYDMILPGLMLGSVWALIGLKRGLPLFAAVPRGMAPHPGEMARGLRVLRRRRRSAFGCWAAWLPVAALILPRVPKRLLFTVFSLSSLLVFVPFVIWVLSACPRCVHHFFTSLNFRLWGFTRWNHCQTCGLGLHDA